MPKTKTVIMFSIIFFGVLFFTKNSWAAVIFENGWERASGIGCTAPQGVVDLHITDQTYHGDLQGWEDDHGINPCDDPSYTDPSAETVTSDKYSGSRSFRQHLPGYTPILRNFRDNWPNGGNLTTLPEIYIRYYVKWAGGWIWKNDADFKSTFTHMTTNQHTYQSTYYGSDPTHGKLKFFWWGGASNVPVSTNISLPVGEWILMEWHLVYGPSAGTTFTEAKVNGTLVEWSTGGTKVYAESVDYPYLGEFRTFSLDGYCNYTGNSGYMYFDDVKITDGGDWIGPTEGAPDTTPPIISNGQPIGTLAAGTTQTTMSVTTNETATCRYSTTAGTSYSSMTGMFLTPPGTSHSTLITGLSNGQTYYRYIRCQDTAGNANTSDYTITFSIASASDTTPPAPPSGVTII